MQNNLYSVSAHLPFAGTLARWVLGRWGYEPLTLARTLIFLPSRRAGLSLREAFLRESGGRALLLPRMETLGDADEDTFLLSPLASLAPEDAPSDGFALRRLFLLARLVQRQRAGRPGEATRIDFALKFAVPLASLLDELEREEITLERLEEIVPGDFAAHWQETVEFLHILSVHWPRIAREEGLISHAQNNARTLKALARHWQEFPPPMPVIAAGTTGSNPATAALLAAIAGLPQGCVVLPGLDMQADDAYFERLEESHPQWGIAQLLKKLGCARADVQAIGEAGNARVRFMSEVMRPAAVSDAWRGIGIAPEALEGMHYIPCAGVHEEASVVALLLREALETPGRTAALVTHNRALSRRVAAILRRFGVMIDDSAGLPLKQTPLAAFLRLMLDAALSGFAALPLLGLLKHPLTQAGFERLDCLEAARELETLVLRGLRTTGGLEGMRGKLLAAKGASPAAYALLDRLEHGFAPLLALLKTPKVPLGELTEATLACAHALGGDDIWEGPEAEAMTQFFREVRSACDADDIHVEADCYPAVFEELLAGRVWRPDYGMHPRLKILSPMEARMQAFDRVILGGLNEGSWPPRAESDPWFSRPMRASLGLPALQRKAGLAAHDFFMLACGREVILTRAGKEDGAPTQALRWLTRLLMLAGGLPGRGEHWAAWAAALDAPARVTPAPRPAPAPPLAARPREMSVTQVETWMRDPYALYASRILRLRALPPLAREPDGSDFGNAAHKALERFVRACPAALPADALAILLACGREAFAELFEGTGLELLWWPRFARIAQWVIAREEERRMSVARTLSEVDSLCRFGDFTLKGRADRVEQGRDGGLTIVDYKTGGLPLMRDIEGGLSSQLVLLALIARESPLPHGGEGIAYPIHLEYWRLMGGDDAGRIKPIDPARIDGYIDAAREGLKRLIARYADAAFPYRCLPVPARAGRGDDYHHLARMKEWG